MRILGIETSCDETAAAVVEDGRRMLSNTVASSVDLHAAYGGVVPEIAARSHLEAILPVIDEALKSASTDWQDIDALAVTQGPGLLGSLLIGVLTARTLAIAKNKPLYGVDHVEAHVYASFITETTLIGYTLSRSQPNFPLLALIVSGGHTQLVLFEDHFKYSLLGQTADDAVGEAFDKVAKILGLSYPGGPAIAEAAASGEWEAIRLPTINMENVYDFSFSGLKTAVLRVAQAASGHDYRFPSRELPGALSKAQKANIAAAFQRAAVKTLVSSLKKAADEFNPKSIVITGGVAANLELRRTTSKELGPEVLYPDIKLCTDNAAMIATAGYYQVSKMRRPADADRLEAQPSLTM